MDVKKRAKQHVILITVILAYSLLLYGLIYWIGKDGSRLVSETVLASIVIFLGTIGIVIWVYRETKRNNKAILDQLYTDPVTGGYNYTRFKMIVQEIFNENPNGKYVVFYSDIKNFKYINDVYGFEVGNKVLKKYSDMLRAEDKIAFARINADKFVSLESYTSESDILSNSLKRIERVSDISGIIEGSSTVTVFVGAFVTNGDNTQLSIDDMVDRANIAQKQIKSRETEGCLLYSESFRISMLAEQELENQMKYAIEKGEFVVYLQPKFNIQTYRIAAAEALVRWAHPEHGLIAPNRFIPLFERNGFIRQLDTYMFDKVCAYIRKWIDEGGLVYPVSVNVSKAQLNNPTFLNDYISIKEQYAIPDGLLEIEFTESLLFDNSSRMSEVLSFFKAHGFRSSIDDFGAGYSSLNLLKTLPADILKLDKLFFEQNEYQIREKVIIKNVISMAKELSMQTVAEGVEKWEQVEFLRSVNCELVQGYVFDRPMSVTEFEQKYIYIT